MMYSEPGDVNVSKGRSPNCPKISLEEAIEKVNKVYKKEHTHPAERLIIAEHMGHKSINGASLTVLGALRQYGLLEDDAGNLRVTDDAVSIIELPPDDHEHIDSLERCAYKPKLFTDLREQFGDVLPSEGNLRHSLIKKGFLPQAADEVIRVYRENLEYLNGQGVYTGSMSQASARRERPVSAPMNASPSLTVQTERVIPSGSERVRVGNDIPISRDCTMGVSATGTVTQEGIEKFIAYLNLIKDAFPSQRDIEAQTEMSTANKKMNAGELGHT